VLAVAACASLSGLSGGGDGGAQGDSGSAAWNVSLVQSAMSTDGPTTFASTEKGDLLVAIGAGISPPSGTGWRQVAQSGQNQDGETQDVLIWPDSPGGLTSFPDQDSTVTFMEFAGAPANVALDDEGDTATFAPGGGSISIGVKAPRVTGELELLALNAGAAMGATVSTGDWNYIGSDIAGDFTWWRAAPATAQQVTCELEDVSLDAAGCGPFDAGEPVDAGSALTPIGSLTFVSLQSL
jgi:hypothetical protein